MLNLYHLEKKKIIESTKGGSHFSWENYNKVYVENIPTILKEIEYLVKKMTT